MTIKWYERKHNFLYDAQSQIQIQTQLTDLPPRFSRKPSNFNENFIPPFILNFVLLFHNSIIGVFFLRNHLVLVYCLASTSSSSIPLTLPTGRSIINRLRKRATETVIVSPTSPRSLFDRSTRSSITDARKIYPFNPRCGELDHRELDKEAQQAAELSSAREYICRQRSLVR